MPELIKASRPFSWINTALPFLAAAIVAGPRTPQAVAAVAVGFLYFLGPYNLAMYGLNDLYDYESDRLNPRKGGSVEGAVLALGARRKVWLAVAVANLPLVARLSVLPRLLAGLLLGLPLSSPVPYPVTSFRPNDFAHRHLFIPAPTPALALSKGLDRDRDLEVCRRTAHHPRRRPPARGLPVR